MEKTYRFVKASERLPEKKGEYFINMIHDNDLPEDGKTKCYTIFDGSIWDAEGGWNIIEWLDENNLEHPSSLIGDAVEFANYLHNNRWMPLDGYDRWEQEESKSVTSTEQLYKLFLSRDH